MGGNLTARTLDAFDAYNLISELKPPNLVTVHKMYLETIWHSKSLSVKFEVTMATTFWQAVFTEFWIFAILMKNYKFLDVRCVILLFFAYFLVNY